MLCSNCYDVYAETDELPELPEDCECKRVYAKEEDVPVVDVGPFLTEQAAQGILIPMTTTITSPTST